MQMSCLFFFYLLFFQSFHLCSFLIIAPKGRAITNDTDIISTGGHPSNLQFQFLSSTRAIFVNGFGWQIWSEQQPTTYYQHQVKMFFFSSVPVSEPLDLGPFGETHNSVNLSWKAIPLEKLQGFLTHYSLCVRKIHPQEKPEGGKYYC